MKFERTPSRRPGPGRRLARWPVITTVAVATLLGFVIPAGGQAGLSLEGSYFEIDPDANLVVDNPSPSIDWATVTETRHTDLASGSGDNSFTQGSKEDTAVPVVEYGSIPPNKSDLKVFGVYQESNANGKFVHMFWTRVQDPSGTTNMDFEFNQSKTASANGVTPVRTANDMLITYDLAKGGTDPTISVRLWNGTAWGAAEDLTSVEEATGSINSSAITAANSDGLGPLDPRTFGEASIDLSTIFNPGVCMSYGSVYLKSRSSDSFTSALKDFIAPQEVSISNCGSVTITKTDDAEPANPLAGAAFTLYTNDAPVGGSGPGEEDTILTGKTCTTAIPEGGEEATCTITGVLAGNYWVVETTTPAGYDTADPQAITVSADEEVSLTFVDPRQRGAILVTKTAKSHADAAVDGKIPLDGAEFTVSGSNLAEPLTGTTGTYATGQVCFDDLLFGDYTVSETGVPTGYAGADDQTVTVNSKAACADATYVGQTASFSNTPLSNITVSFESQVTDGTAATITCTGPDDWSSGTDPLDLKPSTTFEDLIPGTYTCTVVIDP